jgi:predicted phage-related endonuclease
MFAVGKREKIVFAVGKQESGQVREREILWKTVESDRGASKRTIEERASVRKRSRKQASISCKEGWKAEERGQRSEVRG